MRTASVVSATVPTAVSTAVSTTVSSVTHAAPSLDVSHEPVGIVIADGGVAPTSTRFSAYVWGPAPTAEELAAIDRLLEAPLAQPVVRGGTAPNAKDAGRQAGVLAFGEPGWVPDDVMATA